MRRDADDLNERFTAFAREHGERLLRVSRPVRPLPPASDKSRACCLAGTAAPTGPGGLGVTGRSVQSGPPQIDAAPSS